MFTQQAYKYQSLFDGSLPDNQNHHETEDRALEMSFWSQFHRYGQVLLGKAPSNPKRKERRLGGELSPEEQYTVNQAWLDNQRLTELENKGEIELNQDTHLKLHERFKKKKTENHG
jgi:hypothetical protein